MERIVRARLTWFLESRTLLPEAMLGFRAKLSPLDCILDLRSYLEHNQGLKKNTLVVLLDIKRHTTISRQGMWSAVLESLELQVGHSSCTAWKVSQ